MSICSAASTKIGYMLDIFLLVIVSTTRPEGVLVAKKDFNLPKHSEVDTKNLYVYAQGSM